MPLDLPLPPTKLPFPPTKLPHPLSCREPEMPAGQCWRYRDGGGGSGGDGGFFRACEDFGRMFDQIQTAIEIMQNCITDVKLWMTHNKLHLNDSKTESMLMKSHRLSVNFLFLLRCVLEILKRSLFILWKISVSHLTAIKYDSARTEHLQISLHWTQTNCFHTPFTHRSSDSNSRLCFHSVLPKLLQLPTHWLSTVSHWQIAENSERSCTTYL